MNTEILWRLSDSMKVEGRNCVNPIEFYGQMQTFGEAGRYTAIAV